MHPEGPDITNVANYEPDGRVNGRFNHETITFNEGVFADAVLLERLSLDRTCSTGFMLDSPVSWFTSIPVPRVLMGVPFSHPIYVS